LPKAREGGKGGKEKGEKRRKETKDDMKRATLLHMPMLVFIFFTPDREGKGEKEEKKERKKGGLPG